MARQVYEFDRAGIFDGKKEHNAMGYFFPPKAQATDSKIKSKLTHVGNTSMREDRRKREREAAEV